MPIFDPAINMFRSKRAAEKWSEKEYDVVVVGGGLSGVCAAISAARHGAKTALIHNRPVLGGNASSEIRIDINGADEMGNRKNARETGIIEEILLENRYKNPNHSFSVLDTIVWEKVRFQSGLDLYLNTHMFDVETNDSKIASIIACQLTNEKGYRFTAKMFIDGTGDGTLAYLAGANYMIGREGKDIFSENCAPDRSDSVTFGSSIMFKAVDTGHPVKFEKPFWANSYREEDLIERSHEEFENGYWWIELGGKDKKIIEDGELIRDELLKVVYGVWDHIKNSGHHNAQNFTLDWVGFLPGKRESRRIVGDYILKENDLVESRVFDDTVSYGGWPIDRHSVGGLESDEKGGYTFIHLKDIYGIPYRSLYSKNISNLFICGRLISASHVAFASTRVMATCSVIGQAVGTAAAMAVHKGYEQPRELLKDIKQLQIELTKDDCYIPEFQYDNPADLAKGASIKASSTNIGYGAKNVVNGMNRNVHDVQNNWMSNETGKESEWIKFDFDKAVEIKELLIRFDTNLSKEIMPSLSKRSLSRQIPGMPPELVKKYTCEFYLNGEKQMTVSEDNNYKRSVQHSFLSPVTTDSVIIKFEETYGSKSVSVFEVSIH